MPPSSRQGRTKGLEATVRYTGKEVSKGKELGGDWLKLIRTYTSEMTPFSSTRIWSFITLAEHTDGHGRMGQNGMS
jgi:hypothetical protein